MKPSIEQENAIKSELKPNLILAGPGSGKTYTITRRIFYMVNNLKIPEETILVITFTKSASTEMRDRFLKLLCADYSNIKFSTMHALFYSIIKSKDEFREYKIINTQTKDKIFKHIWSKIKPDTNYIGYENTNKMIGDYYNLRYLNRDTTDDLCKLLGKEYINYKNKMKYLDFDDMLYFCYELLLSDKILLSKYRDKYKHILVDEFQDVSYIQYEILKLLVGDNNSIFVVGDDDQSIYKFRGSDPVIINKFIDDYKNCDTYYLSQNYRCSRKIVSLANKVIKNNKSRQNKNIISMHKSDGNIFLKLWSKRADQSIEIVNNIKYLNSIGVENSDITLLVRLKSSIFQIKNKLIENNIPFNILGGDVDTAKRKEFNIILKILSLCLDEFYFSDFLFVMDFMGIFIGDVLINKDVVSYDYIYDIITREKSEEINDFIRFSNIIYQAKTFTPYLAIDYIRKFAKIDKMISQNKAYDIDYYTVIINDICDYAQNFTDLRLFLDEIKEYSDSKKENASENSVTIMTVHASKGLEYRAVLIPDLLEKYFPNNIENELDIEEERRIFYVALTRAKEYLFLYTSKSDNDKKYISSRFVLELTDKNKKI